MPFNLHQYKIKSCIQLQHQFYDLNRWRKAHQYHSASNVCSMISRSYMAVIVWHCGKATPSIETMEISCYCTQICLTRIIISPIHITEIIMSTPIFGQRLLYVCINEMKLLSCVCLDKTGRSTHWLLALFLIVQMYLCMWSIKLI